MSTFRFFGPPAGSEPATRPDGVGGVTWAPGSWAGDPAPATRHARPAGLDAPSTPGPGHRGAPPNLDDPPTDPHGFPALPVSWSTPPRPPSPGPAEPLPDPREAAALAGAFAADYLSWDEDDPGRRGRALADHLAAPADDPALVGWNGVGRQRADFALPGAVRPDGDDRVLVDVRVRVTPYRAVGERTAAEPEPEPDVPGVPAAAPAPEAGGWLASASYWVRLIVPVVRDDARLVVDAGEEALPGEEAHAAADDPRSDPPDTRAPSPREHAPVPEREPEGAW